MVVYVSAGTGTWGPPVRFGTNPGAHAPAPGARVKKRHRQHYSVYVVELPPEVLQRARASAAPIGATTL